MGKKPHSHKFADRPGGKKEIPAKNSLMILYITVSNCLDDSIATTRKG
jgi:hypothetical protein